MHQLTCTSKSLKLHKLMINLQFTCGPPLIDSTKDTFNGFSDERPITDSAQTTSVGGNDGAALAAHYGCAGCTL